MENNRSKNTVTNRYEWRSLQWLLVSLAIKLTINSIQFISIPFKSSFLINYLFKSMEVLWRDVKIIRIESLPSKSTQNKTKQKTPNIKNTQNLYNPKSKNLGRVYHGLGKEVHHLIQAFDERLLQGHSM